MKKQKILGSILVISIALAFLSYIGFYAIFSFKNKYIPSLFINYWITLLLFISTGIVLYIAYQAKQKDKLPFSKLQKEYFLTWIVILFLLTLASFLCWRDLIINELIQIVSNTTSTKIVQVLQLFSMTFSVLLLIALLFLPQAFILFQFYLQRKKLHAQHSNL